MDRMFLKNILLILTLINICYPNISNGLGMEMHNTGTTVYYMPNYIINKNIMIINDLGYYYSKSNGNSIVLSPGVSFKLIKNNLLGIFIPAISFQSGYNIKLNTSNKFKINNNLYNFGLALKFYNLNILNEFMLRFNNIFHADPNISIKLSIYLSK